jgi:ATP-dependent RNA helicase DeaD
MPPPIKRLAESYMYDPTTIRITPKTLTVDAIAQAYVEVPAKEKPEKLVELLRAEEPEQAIIFCRTKIGASRLEKTLKDRRLDVKALHGDMSQGARDGVMISFKGGRVPILVATDVAARGLDIVSVTHIVNFDIPTSPDVYVHRIGRTGRVGRSGRAITFIEPRQRRALEAIERHANTKISPWAEGAHIAPSVASEPPRRHRKPHDEARNGTGYRKLIASGGRAAGLSEADLIAAVHGAGLDGEAIRRVRLLERFALLEVPGDDCDRVVAALDGTELNGHALALEPIRDN